MAFFHADMDELVYLKPPPGEEEPDVWWVLYKALYGAGSASRLLNDFALNVMRKDGAERIAVCDSS